MVSRARVTAVLGFSFWLGLSLVAAAAQAVSAPGASPRLMKLGGVLKDAQGVPRSGTLRVTFAIYAEPEGGTPLWAEAQDVAVGAHARYEVLLGSSRPEGFPEDLLGSAQTRWLGVQVEGEPEQRPRVMLVSVFHALKADDAESLSGKALSELVQVEELKTPQGRKKLGLAPMATTDDVFTATANPGPGFISLALTGPPLAVSSSEVVTNLNADLLDNLDSAAFAQLAAANVFTADQTITGNLSVSGNAGIGGTIALPSSVLVQAGVDRFLHNFGISNTFVGVNAGNLTMTGLDNTASGAFALINNTTGTSNTASGRAALAFNTTGNFNTANGRSALLSNTTGSSNTASGGEALFSNTTGNSNTASGRGALRDNTTGLANTASGEAALLSNTTGSFNTASGAFALINSTTGSLNTASGVSALFSNTTGGGNTASGASALRNSTGNNNIAIGQSAGFFLTTGSDNICIGNFGAAGESATTRIGEGQARTFIAGIHGVTVTGSMVLIDSSGQLGTVPSSARFKEEILDMGMISSGLLKLRPVSFRYKGSQGNARHFGLIAEEVEQVLPELVVHTPAGEAETVLYHEMPAMLVNELQKQQRRIEALEARLAELEGAARETHISAKQ